MTLAQVGLCYHRPHDGHMKKDALDEADYVLLIIAGLVLAVAMALLGGC